MCRSAGTRARNYFGSKGVVGGASGLSSGAERIKTSAPICQWLCPSPSGQLDVTDKNPGVNAIGLRKNYRPAKGMIGTCPVQQEESPHSPKSSLLVQRLHEGKQRLEAPPPPPPFPRAARGSAVEQSYSVLTATETQSFSNCHPTQEKAAFSHLLDQCTQLCLI